MKWQEVKDMFRESVGDVTYVELFSDENDKPRGCGILEFSSVDLAKKAIEKMHRTELKGRKLVVKEDFDSDRDKFGRLMRGGGGGGRSRSQERDRERRDRDRDDRRRGGGSGSDAHGSGGAGLSRNTYGLSPQFLESLNIDCPLHTRLFVANVSFNSGSNTMGRKKQSPWNSALPGAWYEAIQKMEKSGLQFFVHFPFDKAFQSLKGWSMTERHLESPNLLPEIGFLHYFNSSSTHHKFRRWF